jgi:hypothetical protein
LRRRNLRGLGPASTPVARRPRRGSSEPPGLATYLLVQACQHLGLVLGNDACGGSPGLTIPRPPGPRPPWCWQSQPVARALAALPWEEDTLCRGLRTPPLPGTHALVGDSWRNSWCCHLLYRERATQFLRHPRVAPGRSRSAAGAALPPALLFHPGEKGGPGRLQRLARPAELRCLLFRPPVPFRSVHG